MNMIYDIRIIRVLVHKNNQIRIPTHKLGVNEGVKTILNYLKNHGLLV